MAAGVASQQSRSECRIVRFVLDLVHVCTRQRDPFLLHARTMTILFFCMRADTGSVFLQAQTILVVIFLSFFCMQGQLVVLFFFLLS